MSGYISKERAKICVMSAIEGSEDEGVLRALDDVRLAISSEPDAHVVPEVRGHWVVEDLSVLETYTCSVCKHVTAYLGVKYCPECGAKMDESEGKQ